MKNFTRFGRVLFGMGMLGFGAMNFVYATPVQGIEPLPDDLAGRLLWVYATGLLLAVGGLIVILDFLQTRATAIGLCVLLFLWVVLLHVAMVATQPHNGSAWTSTFECLALGCSAWMLADASDQSGMRGEVKQHRLTPYATMLARYGFGLSLPVFGALHFIYWQYVASVIPGWIPGSPVFWAYFTGCAHVAAGLAILSGVAARLASILLGIMFTSWVVIVHVPRVLAHPDHPSEWTSLCVAVALSGGAWLMAGYFSRAAAPSGKNSPLPASLAMQ